MKTLSATQGQIIQSMKEFFCLLDCFEVKVKIFGLETEFYAEVSWVFESSSSNRGEKMLGETVLKYFSWYIFTKEYLSEISIKLFVLQ